MKEVVTLATNTIGNITTAGKLVANVELAFVLTEPRYAFDEGGEMRRSRTTETVRFTATPDAMRQLSKQLLETADSAESDLTQAIEKTLQ